MQQGKPDGMPSFKHAQDAVAKLDLEESNRAMADHWLSLWEGNALPSRAKFSPGKMKAFLPNIIMFHVVPDVGVSVRLAGTGFRHFLDEEITGGDWIAWAPQSHRATRLNIFSTIARGAIGVAHRRIAMTVGDDYLSEEILLPFAPEPNGSSTVLVYVNFKAEHFLKIKSMSQVVGEPVDFKLVALERLEVSIPALT